MKRHLRGTAAMVLVVALILPLLFGCGTIRKEWVKLSESDVKNVEALADAGENCLKIWPFKSGCLRKALRERNVVLPQLAMKAWAELDELSACCGEKGCDFSKWEHKDEPTLPFKEKDALRLYALGSSYGDYICFLVATVIDGIKLVAPDLLDIIPFAL